MGRLRPDKLHVTFGSGMEPHAPITPRCYTLTHSDVSGDLFLTIAPGFNREQISGFYVRLMRDEVLGEWVEEQQGYLLHLYCHVSGGLTLGPARFRLAIFRRELPLVLEALRYGDRYLFEARPSLDEAPVLVHFHATQRRYDSIERWGTLGEYQLEE